MRAFLFCTLILHIFGRLPLSGGDSWQPFDPAVISRLSVDDVPRSLSICQGGAVWLAYDLEHARIIKCWQADKSGQGLQRKAFVTQSKGKTLWKPADTDAEKWRFLDNRNADLVWRYLGCKDQRTHILLTWEVRHQEHSWQVEERVPLAKMEDGRIIRELRVTGLKNADKLVPPELQNPAWKLQTLDSQAVTAIATGDWHQLILKP